MEFKLFVSLIDKISVVISVADHIDMCVAIRNTISIRSNLHQFL